MKAICQIKTILGISAGLFFVTSALAQQANTPTNEEFPDRIVGDLGAGVYVTPSEVRGVSTSTLPLPYAYVDYGRFFSRIDTLGVKTFKMGYGYFELAGRVNFDGFSTSNATLRGLHDRENSIPLGVGTFQETPIGAFFINAFYDVNKSHGALLETLYAGEIKAGPVTFYPQAGAEYRSANYVNYYYGITPTESAANRIYKPYQGQGTTNPLVALQIEIPLNESWVVNVYGRYTWLGDGIKDSPIVDKKATQNYFVSLAYRFK